VGAYSAAGCGWKLRQANCQLASHVRKLSAGRARGAVIPPPQRQLRWSCERKMLAVDCAPERH
jgi:outer membrane lipopolysaccharide assembly protein LptE/RlpB